MRVGFDAHMVNERETGNETYALGLLHGFDQIGFPVDVYAFGAVETRWHRVHRIWPQQSVVRIPFSLPWAAIRDTLDLLHTTYTLPPLLPCPAVVSVHDITFALHPEWFREQVRHMLGTLVPLAMRRAAHVITISQRTRCDIVERYGISPERVSVTYLAPRPTILPHAETAGKQGEFFLFVGNVEPRKNVDTLIRAMRILRERRLEIPLVVAGKPGLRYGEVLGLVHDLGLDRLVRFIGYVSDERLRDLYATCIAYLHPALYEGFGLTPLEAMTHGVPVIASNNSSLPEVVGDAGILLPAQEAEAWAEAMESIATDHALRDVLAARGRIRAQQFSWRGCALETLEVYRHATQLQS